MFSEPSTSPLVVTIHFLASAIVHCLLLLLELAESFSNRHTVWYWTCSCLALSRMQLKQSPDSLAHMTATRGLHLALSSMLQQPLHLGAIGRWARRRAASSSVEQEGHVKLNASLALLALRLRQLILLPASDRDRFQLVRMPRCVWIRDAVVTLIVVSADGAVVAIPGEDLS